MELRAIQKRNRDEAIRARKAGEPKQRPSYGYLYVRPAPMAKVDHVALDPVGAEIIREVARRILAVGTPYPRRDRRRISAWIAVDGWHGWGALKDSSQPG